MTDKRGVRRIRKRITIRFGIDETVRVAFTDDISMILSIGVEFGKPGFDNQPVEVKRAGCAKVLGVK